MKKWTLTLLVALMAFTLAAQKKQYNSLMEALMSGSFLRGERGPAGVEWIQDSDRYSYTSREGRDQQIWTYDIKTESVELVFGEGDHTFPGTEDPFRYRSFEWTHDYSHLLFQTNFEPIWRYSGNADYFLYSLEDQSLTGIVEDAFTAEVSPDGTKVGYGKDGNLFTFDLATGKHTQLTTDGADKFYNGRFGWANEEEFGLVQAWEWSYDSRFIAFWQTDEREVPVYQLTDFAGLHPEYMQLPYPKVGDNPPVERLGVINVADGTKKWLDIDPEGGYMPRIYWTSMENTLAVVWMNRAQNHLKLYLFDVVSGEKRMIMEEKDEAYIDIFDFFVGELHLFYFPEEMDSFFWISDRDGYSHIYQYDYEGNVLSQVTSGSYDVIAVKAIDPAKKTLYYLSCERSPMERSLYSVKFNGKGKKELTPAPGNHRVDVAPGGRYFIDSYSSTSTPSTIDLCDGKGKLVKNLAGHEATLDYLETNAYSPRELFSFTTSDGQKLDGYLIKPADFDPEKSYPLIMAVYGGPGSQGVYNTFETSGWNQYLVQQGYVIANINNRGNGGYGSAFEKVVYKQLGKWETHDFAEAALYLSEKPWIDRERIGIMGHSYGAFSAGMSLLLHPDVFKAGIVTAAPADQRNYDCIYTERYMGLLEDNEEGYENSSMVHLAGNLEGKMLLVHSLMDDNVHPQNTFQLVTALISAGKQFDLKIFPPGAHGVAWDMNSQLYLYQLYLDWLNENLKGTE